MSTWKPIGELPEMGRGMFVVKSFGYVFPDTGQIYTSDPYCVWKEGNCFVRWPHSFEPTHFLLLPAGLETK